MKRTLTAAFAGAIAFTVLATTEDQTLYVNKAAASGGDGETMETAFNTIAAAIAKAQTGWTVLVAPGTYDTEEVVDDFGYTNRVYINKRIHLKSTGGKAVTHIVGKWAKDSVHATFPGIGADAVRCIQMTSAAYYSVVEGFTIRDGACHTTNDNVSGYGGGVVGNGSSYFVVDCVISNCTAVRGGALRDVTAVRSWITRNTGGTAAGRRVNFVNCLITANYGTGGALMDNMLINCTVAGNPVTPLMGNITAGYKCYNCVFANNVNLPSSNTPVTADGCVFNSGSTPGFLSNASTSLGNSATRWDGFDYNFFAPLVNDWRLLSTSQAIGRGNASHLSNSALYVRDNVDYHKDFNGNAIPSTGTINAGCIQTPGPTPAGGAVQFAGPSIANGETSGGVDLYAFSETYPAQFKVKPILAANERPIYVERSPAAEYDLFPQMDDSVWVITPPAGIVQTNTFVVTTNIVYVSPTGNDANSGLSPDAPKKTLQAAVDAPTESAVIVAAEGTYDEGGKVQNGVSNRVYISYVARRYIRLVGAGRGKSIIKGAPDPDNPTRVAGDGRGPNACRCVCIGSVGVVQGFTLTDGFSGYDSANPGADDNSGGSTRGGAFTVNTSGSNRPVNRYLYDCDITSSSANQGSAAYCGTLVRCHVSNCITSTRGGTRYARLYSCLVDGTPSDGVSTASLYSGGCSAFQCTFSESDGDGDVVPKSTASPAGSVSGLTNCIMRTKSGKLTASKSSNGANVMDGEATNATYAQYVVENGGAYGDSLLKDADGSDYRPISCSPAVGGGALADDFYLRYTSDFNGDAILFAGGKPTCGAIHTTVQGVVVPKARYGTITLPSSVTNGVDEGETLVVSLANSTRPCAGFVVDGVTNLTDDTTYTFTGGASGALTETVTIAPVYLPHWYVDAVNGNDASNGFTRVSAKKTLKGVMDLGNNIYGGDTIHAAEGVYDEGEMEYNNGAVKARVVVPNGVNLVADGRREYTIIEGKASDESDELGNGPGAVRCVVLVNENANKCSIKGFTLRNGHTLSGVSTDADYVGGGVYTARNAADPLGVCVIDCIITNCCANRGGAGYNRIDYVNCLVVGNRAASAVSGIANGAAYGCVFARNTGNICVYTSYDIVNCTLFDNYDGASVTYDIANPQTGAAVYNTVAKGKVTGNSSYYLYASNCVFNATYSSDGQKKFCDAATRWVDESLLEFDFYGAPLGTAHPVVDKAETSFLSRFVRMDYEKDALGGQRIYNGALDIGAVEYDWRKDFAQMLGGGMASVNAASSSVVTSSVDSVTIRAGELDMTLANRTGLNVRYTIPVEVVGSGTLTVTNNGETLAVLTSSDGATSLVFKNRLAANDVLFAYDGSDAGVLIGKFGIKVPNMVMSFR